MKKYVTDEDAVRTVPPLRRKNTDCICQMCGELFTADNLKDFKKKGEAYYHQKGCFFCPDCWDDFQYLPLERQTEILIMGAEVTQEEKMGDKNKDIVADYYTILGELARTSKSVMELEVEDLMALATSIQRNKILKEGFDDLYSILDDIRYYIKYNQIH